MKEAFASWMKGVNVAAVTISTLTLAVSILGFGLMVRAELSAFRAEMSAFRTEIRAELSEFKAEVRADNAAFKADIRADNAAFKADIRAEIATFKADIRADIAEIRADYKELSDKIDRIASVLDTRLDDIEREQARMQGVISVLQDAVDVSQRQPAADP